MDWIRKLSAHIHWVVFILLESLSGFMLLRFNSYQGSVWLTQANTVAGMMAEWESRVLRFLYLSVENDNLVKENLVLQHNIKAMRDEVARLAKDSTYTERLQTERLSCLDLVPAKVVSNSVMQKDNFLTVNVGSADGVAPEMGVVSGTGVVGIVCKVTPHYALVMSVLHSKSSISARLRGTEYFGYMKWGGGSPLLASMDGVPRHARVKVGDAVETSGYSSVFPPGIFLGRVARIRDSKDGLTYALDIQMSTDIAKTGSVCVVRNKDKAEIDSLYNGK